jgi:signal transduction histidine kinase
LHDGKQHKNLRIQISDDGCGLPDRLRHGVGMSSMRERAEELGGRLVLAASAQGGTKVRADLPLPEQGAS